MAAGLALGGLGGAIPAAAQDQAQAPAPAPAAAKAADPDAWRFNLAAYGWLISVSGNVTAKSFEIHGSATPTVSVTGTARDNTALLKTTDDLRKIKEVQGLKIEQIRGKAPQQFTFTFRWNVNSSTP